MNTAALIDQKHNLRMNIWRLLSSHQKSLVARQIASPAFLEHLGYNALQLILLEDSSEHSEPCKISKSKVIRESFLTLCSLSKHLGHAETHTKGARKALNTSPLSNVIDAREAFRKQSERLTHSVEESRVIYVDFLMRCVVSE